MSKIVHFWAISVLAVLSLSRGALGQDEPRMELIVDEDKVAWVGEKVPVYVELKAPGLFAGTPKFELPDVPNAVFMKLNQRPTLRTEKIDQTTFTVQRHAFAIYSQAAGRLSVPAFAVSFSSSMKAGDDPTNTSLTTPQFEIQTRMPPGAEAATIVITTAELTVDESWGEIPKKVKVGDAITRSISVRARDVPAMTLPRIPFDLAEGIDVYPKAPQLDDTNNRGRLQAERVDQVTYVCKEPGIAIIPAMKIQWWDPEKERLQTFGFAKKEFEIASIEADPVEGTVGEVSERSGGNAAVVMAFGAAIALICVVGFLAWRFYLKEVWGRMRSKLQNSERSRYHQLKVACQHDDAARTYNALMLWIADYGPQETRRSLDSFLRDANIDVDCDVFVELLKSIQQPNAQWRGQALLGQLDALRSALQRNEKNSANAELAPLNPEGHSL